MEDIRSKKDNIRYVLVFKVKTVVSLIKTQK